MTSIRKLGKYEILTELGRGGFATVYQARDTHLRREVALKVIHGSHSHDPTFIERFHQEAQTAASLHHRCLITIYDFGEIEGQLYLVMRYISGPSLAQLLAERGRLSLAEALPLLAQLAEALDHLHAQLLVHRDLKPANVLLEGESPHWQVTLADFGLIRSLTSSQVITQTTSILGTPAYLAPEQADSQRWGDVTTLTDIYALGVLVYQMLLGRLPFEGEPAGLLHAHAYDEPLVPPELALELGNDLVELLLKALAKSPQQRFPSARALVEALRGVETQRAQQQTRQAELAELLTQAQVARQKSDWFTVNQLCLQIMAQDRGHPEALQLLVEAGAGLQREQAEETARRKRQNLYEQGEQALARGDWPGAIRAFEQVAAENPDFREVQHRLAQAREEQARAGAYDEAIAQGEAGHWAAACQTWLGVVEGRQDYRQGEAMARLLAAVAQLLAQFEQVQEDLHLMRTALPIYHRLTTAIYHKQWDEAVRLLEQIQILFPGTPWTPPWLEEARRHVAIVGQSPSVATGEVRIWQKDGKEMVRVPPGEFLYGAKKEKRTLPEFWIDKTPVTNAEYRQFLKANPKYLVPFVDEDEVGAYNWDPKTRTFPHQDKANHPVVLVSWQDAVAYAEWVGKRLPTEEEWEKAARGTDGRKYPWGDQRPTSELCNFGDPVGGTTPVGHYSPQGDSPYSCVDMSGNVSEWTASDYDRLSKVGRGGSWMNDDVEVIRVAYRNFYPPETRSYAIGFRCAVSAGEGDGE